MLQCYDNICSLNLEMKGIQQLVIFNFFPHNVAITTSTKNVLRYQK